MTQSDFINGTIKDIERFLGGDLWLSSEERKNSSELWNHSSEVSFPASVENFRFLVSYVEIPSRSFDDFRSYPSRDCRWLAAVSSHFRSLFISKCASLRRICQGNNLFLYLMVGIPNILCNFEVEENQLYHSTRLLSVDERRVQYL